MDELEISIDADLVTPGVIGFSFTLLFMLAVILLLVNMTRRIRRMNYLAEISARLDTEENSASS